jgi:hypothetical protein
MSAQRTASARTEIRLASIQDVEPLPLDPEQVALFVSQMSAELAVLARSARLDVLAYFLDMARVEAASVKSSN